MVPERPFVRLSSIAGWPEDALAEAPTETEIKLVLEPGARIELEKHPAFANPIRAIPQHRELTTYFDTDELSLRRLGYSLRIRESDGSILQTLKKMSPYSASVHRRSEWEWRLEKAKLALRPLKPVLAEQPDLDGDLRQANSRFVTDIRRRTYEVVLGGCEIEAAVDEGVVRTEGKEELVCELELEIKSGPLGPAYRLALELLQHQPMRLGDENKADRGYRLLTGCEASPVKVRSLPLPSGASLGVALNWTAGAALHGFVANLPAVRAGNPEGVHQARIALRRLRTMLALYTKYLEPGACKRFNNAIRTMGLVLGAARDWDVFMDETLGAARCAGVAEDWLVLLQEPAHAKRERARAAVRSLLDGKAPAELVLGVQAWTTDPDWAIRDCPPGTPVSEIMPNLLDRIASKVARRGRNATRLSPQGLHPLRKSLKKLRYSVESVSALYSAKRVITYVKVCKRLQTVLGAINDSQVTARLLGELVPADSAALAGAAGAVQAWNDERLKETRAGLGKVWRKLCEGGPFWD
jgi:triphosphatase